MRSFYGVDRKEIVGNLLSLFKMSYLKIENRTLWLASVELYKERNISLIDIFLHTKAKAMQAEVLSFDKDFRKLAK